ncbi:hypothetical protein FHG87_010848 [Trinorchestia longiramus]|nr:hypothetical protein FHG87_010848 [Trinorchestia longiramus]
MPAAGSYKRIRRHLQLLLLALSLVVGSGGVEQGESAQVIDDEVVPYLFPHFPYKETVANLEEGEVDVRLNSFKGCFLKKLFKARRFTRPRQEHVAFVATPALTQLCWKYPITAFNIYRCRSSSQSMSLYTLQSSLLLLLLLSTFSSGLPSSPIAPRMLPARLGMLQMPKSMLLLRSDFRPLDPRTVVDRMGRTALLETQLSKEINSLIGNGIDEEERLQHLNDIKGGRMPKTSLTLSECRDSVECHQLFSRYLGLLLNVVQ